MKIQHHRPKRAKFEIFSEARRLEREQLANWARVQITRNILYIKHHTGLNTIKGAKLSTPSLLNRSVVCITKVLQVTAVVISKQLWDWIGNASGSLYGSNTAVPSMMLCHIALLLVECPARLHPQQCLLLTFHSLDSSYPSDRSKE